MDPDPEDEMTVAGISDHEVGPIRRHEFIRRNKPDGGHLDRKCEECGLDDRNPVHD